MQNFTLAYNQINSKNSLLQFVTQTLKFFFEMKLNLKLLDQSQKENENIDIQIERDIDGDIYMNEENKK